MSSEITDQTRVLVTGANGFVGRHLVPHLASRGFRVIAASRKMSSFKDSNITNVPLPDLSGPFEWRPLVEHCDAVVHLAGIAHKFAPDDMYNRVNYQATAALAQASHECGVDHLVFVSSVAAQCGSFSYRELTENDPPRPTNAYGRSKLAAEKAVSAAGISSTIIRPVVIYGGGEKGNFATIHMISRLPIPLPFGALTARRSILLIDNFCSAVETALTNPKARGETLIISDPTPVTVAEIIARYRVGRGKPPWLLPIPEKWLELSFKAIGQGAMWERLGCPLVAPPTKFISMGWNPVQASYMRQ